MSLVSSAATERGSSYERRATYRRALRARGRAHPPEWRVDEHDVGERSRRPHRRFGERACWRDRCPADHMQPRALGGDDGEMFRSELVGETPPAPSRCAVRTQPPPSAPVPVASIAATPARSASPPREICGEKTASHTPTHDVITTIRVARRDACGRAANTSGPRAAVRTMSRSLRRKPSAPARARCDSWRRRRAGSRPRARRRSHRLMRREDRRGRGPAARVAPSRPSAAATGAGRHPADRDARTRALASQRVERSSGTSSIPPPRARSRSHLRPLHPPRGRRRGRPRP